MKTLTVGIESGDIQGSTGATIQEAINRVSADGGGVVEVLPGEYTLQNAISLKSNITLKGTPGKTILKRAPLAVSKLTCDADRGQKVIYPEDVSRFKVGMGIGLYDRKSEWTKTSTPYEVVAVHDDHIEIDRILSQERYWENDGAVVNYYPMINVIEVDHTVIEGFEVDGTSVITHSCTNAIEQDIADSFHDWAPYFTDRIRAPRTALVFHQSSPNAKVTHVHAYNGAGDGLCFSMASEHMVMQYCETDHNGWYGIHPGSHSAFSDVSHCHIHDNASDGLYVCWGIHHSTFTHNNIHDNGWAHWRSGISIGHKDSDNLIEKNSIVHNAKHGIAVRNKTPQNAPHRCTYRDNDLENNCALPTELLEIKSQLPPEENIIAQVRIGTNVCDLAFVDNHFRETREEMLTLDTAAISKDPSAQRITTDGNKLEGIKTLIVTQ